MGKTNKGLAYIPNDQVNDQAASTKALAWQGNQFGFILGVPAAAPILQVQPRLAYAAPFVSIATVADGRLPAVVHAFLPAQYRACFSGMLPPGCHPILFERPNLCIILLKKLPWYRR